MERRDAQRRRVAGPPNQGQRDISKVQSAAAMGNSQLGRTRQGGAAGTGGPTPDAKVRQKVLNRNAEKREALKQGTGIIGPKQVQGPPTGGTNPAGGRPMPGTDAFRNLSRPEQIKIERSLGGGPGSGKNNKEIVANARAEKVQQAVANEQAFAPQPQGPKPLGTPGAGAAPPRTDNGIVPPPTVSPRENDAVQSISQALGGEMPSSGAVSAVDGMPPGDPASADAIRAAAKTEVSQGQVPQPPGGINPQGEYQPNPSMSPQEEVSTIQAQTDAMMQQTQPEPPMPKSPLGNDSPIEQADVQGKLRAGQRHHLRALGMAQPGMDPKTAKEFERKAVRDMDLFGEYPGMDDPHSPPPPVRPGKHSFNPMTAQWVTPEGQVSVLDRFGSAGVGGPPNEMSIKNVTGKNG